MRSILNKPCELLEALQSLVPGASNRTLRQMLEQGRVRVDGTVCNRAKQFLAAGSVVEVGSRTNPPRDLHGIEILYEDNDLIVVQKPAGMLSVSTPDEKDRTVHAHLRDYLEESGSARALFVVHRLDKFVSGVLVFAKTLLAKERLKALFEKHQVQRKYWAIVEGKVEKDRGTIESYLAENSALRMHSTKRAGQGKQAITHYRILRRFSNLTTLEVQLETGRKNQIRVHLAEMGHPIVGDRSYDSTMNPMGRIGLHAFLLSFQHPRTSGMLLFRTPPPSEFRKYLPRGQA